MVYHYFHEHSSLYAGYRFGRQHDKHGSMKQLLWGGIHRFYLYHPKDHNYDD